MKKLFPYLLVFIQLSSLLFLLVSAPALALTPQGLLVEVAGIFLGLRAIYIMNIGNFNISPLIRANAILVEKGPYKYIRHPMYLAQVVMVAPLVVDYFTWIRMAVIMLLIVNLLVKIQFEEKQLESHFPGYAEYRQKTWKLIPFLY
ncbi:MAG: isoprenylcysteine carboxylmethyltransferase family protein [Bacteroidales bacterium]|nr:isoprenylcysteine carboxylmethyltransferase family protein [Bacteroidales bacterium]